MPFVEIGESVKDWGRIGEEIISLSISLRDKYFLQDAHHGFEKKVRVFYDEENGLVGLMPDTSGYTFRQEKFTMRSLKRMNIARGKFKAHWNAEKSMVIIDLNDPVTIF